MEDFYKFLKRLPHSEAIDELAEGFEHERKQIADFFFLDRKIACEVKSLNKDTKEKIEKIIDNLRERDDFPIFYGEWDVKKILKHLHDGDAIYEKIAYSITSPIEDHIKDANRQIRDTRSVFQQPQAAGLAIVVNRSVDILDAETMGWRISRCLTKKRSDGTRRFECVDAVWLIDEAHRLQIKQDLAGPVSIIIEGDGKETKFVSDYIEYLTIQWATWNGFPAVKVSESMLNKDQLRSANKDYRSNKDKENLKRHEFWRECYKRAPYLRPMSKAQFLDYGRKLLAETMPYFLKNGKKATKQEMMIAMEKFTDFLEETNYRGIDMREFEFNKIDPAQSTKKEPQQDAAADG